MIQLILISMLFSVGQNHNKRMLDVYTSDIANPLYQKQLQLLSADRAGLMERDMIVVKHVRDAHNTGGFNAAKINNSFTIILTGKDGGEKFRSVKPVTLKKLYGIIDAMPMRKEEMKKY